jgi:hypothetical protein
LVLKNIIFKINIKEKSNPIETCCSAFGIFWDSFISFCRLVVVIYSIMMKVWSVNEKEFTMEEFAR